MFKLNTLDLYHNSNDNIQTLVFYYIKHINILSIKYLKSCVEMTIYIR